MTAEASTSFAQSHRLRLVCKPGFILVAVLIASWGVRWIAFLNGGQEYWPDESRFQGSREIVGFLVAGEWRGAANSLFSHADHTLFRWIGTPAAALALLFPGIPWIPSVYFSLFSVLAIYLLFRVAKAAGADDHEALLAACVYAATGSLFAFSRHFFPYDSSLCLVLLAWELSLRSRRFAHSFWVGVLAGCAFLIYNGYWLAAGAVLAVHVCRCTRIGEAIGGGLIAFAGLLMPVFGVFAGGWWFSHDLLSDARSNAGTIVQGDFGIGYRLIPEYLWSADGWIAVGLAIGLLGGIYQIRQRTASTRLQHFMLGALFVVTGLIVLSDLRPTFVVYGRLTRTLVPLLCLVFAGVACGWLRSLSRPGQTAFGSVLIIWLGLGAAWNFFPVLTLRFPRDFQIEALRRADLLETGGTAGVMRIVNAEHIWGERLVPNLPPHEEIWRVPHPLRYVPYQLEGFSEAQRRVLQEGDIDMRLIRILQGVRMVTGEDVDRLQPYFGPLRVRLRLPVDAVGKPEPILTAGTTGAACFVYLLYESAATVRVGFDNWGYGAALSDPIPLGGRTEHVVEISMGALYPPAVRERMPMLSETVLIRFDGINVLARRVSFHPARPDQVDLGRNRVGGSASGTEFTGTIEGIERVAISEANAWFPAVEQLPEQRGPAWGGFAGPFRTRVSLGVSEPGRQSLLMYVPMQGGSGHVYLDDIDAGKIRLGVQLPGDPAVTWSKPQVVGADRMVEFDVGGGNLLPPSAPEPGLDLALWARARGQFTIDWGAKRILQVPVSAPSVEPTAFTTSEAAINPMVDAKPFAGLIQRIEPLSAEDYAVRAADVVRLVNTSDDAGVWAGFPGALAVELDLRARLGRPAATEPLLVSGRSGAGDFIFLRFLQNGSIQVGYDHWGSADELISDPIAMPAGQIMKFVVIGGPLMPPAESNLYRERPDLLAWRSRLRIEVDGRVIFDRTVPVHVATADSLTVGLNRIGGSTTAARLSGDLRSVTSLRERVDVGP